MHNHDWHRPRRSAPVRRSSAQARCEEEGPVAPRDANLGGPREPLGSLGLAIPQHSHPLHIGFVWVLTEVTYIWPPWLSGSYHLRSVPGGVRSSAYLPAPLAVAIAGTHRARSHCRSAPPLIHSIPYSLTCSVPLIPKRRCDWTPGEHWRRAAAAFALCFALPFAVALAHGH